MPQDSFHIRRLAVELSARLRGGKVNRISQADKNELTLIIYTGKTTLKLLLSTNASFARVCFTDEEKEPEPVAPNFCMLLRKHLLGAEILSVSQHDFERIVEIEFLCKNDFSSAKRTLVCELMGKYSNITLVENGVILGALKTTSLETNSKRVLFPGAKFSYPERQNKLSPFDTEALGAREKAFFSARERNTENEAEFLFSNAEGLALSTAREISKRNTGELSVFVGKFCVSEENNPHLLLKNGEPIEFFAFPVENGIPVSSLCEAENIYYTHRESARVFSEKKLRLEGAVRALKKKSEKNLHGIEERLQEAEKAEKYKLFGELLTANLYRTEKGASSLLAENWYVSPPTEIEIPLDKTLSPSQNAQKYFKAYAKQKRAKEILCERRDKERTELSYAESIALSVSLAETENDLKETEKELIDLGLLHAPRRKIGGSKKKDEPVPFREYTFRDFKIYAGRNNVQNDRLLKIASSDDLWLHTQKYHSSHVIVETRNRPVPADVLEYAAALCAYYSDGRNGDKIPVDYTKRKYVKKPSKAKAGFVIYTEQKTLLVTPKKP